MTKEEYMVQTNIKSPEEAKEYLKHLNLLFWSIFLAGIIIRIAQIYLSDGLFLLLFLAHISLLVYFVYYCIQVKKAIKMQVMSAAFAILFAPISWLWFYSAITGPLKIIIGKTPVPDRLLIQMSSAERKERDKSINKKVLRTILIGLGVYLLLVIGIIVFVIFT